MYTHAVASRYASPWSLGYRLRMLLWEYSWPLLCSWTPKHFYLWRLFVLRSFGTAIHGRPFVHQRARIEHPWNLTLHHRSCLGDRAHAYCLGPVEIHQCLVARRLTSVQAATILTIPTGHCSPHRSTSAPMPSWVPRPDAWSDGWRKGNCGCLCGRDPQCSSWCCSCWRSSQGNSFLCLLNSCLA